MNNVGKVCPGCMKKRKAETQENIVERIQWLLEHKEAFDVKKAFTDENGTEHMWVRSYCIDFKGRKLHGTLNNDPVIVKNIKHGNRAEVRFCDIEQIYVWGGRKNMLEKQEIHCHSCNSYVQFDIDVELNGNHVLACPKCGHEHCRVVTDGVITDARWDQRNGAWATNTVNVTSYTVTMPTTYIITNATVTSASTYDTWHKGTSSASTDTGTTAGTFMYQSGRYWA